jgi:hypothetical protein
VDLSQSVLEALRTDEELVLYRGAHSHHFGLSSILQLAPVSMRPAPETLEKIEHEYSLKDELDSAWALGPVRAAWQTTLVLEDPGGETLDRFLSGPIEITSSCASPSVSQGHSGGCPKGS